MIGSVILRHDVMRRLPKLLLIALGLASLVFTMIVYRDEHNGQGDVLQGWMAVAVQVCVYLSATFVLMTPEAGCRCRNWELSLPVRGRFWWRGHYLSLLLGGFCTMLVFSVVPLFLLWLDSIFDGPLFAPIVDDYGTLVWQIFALPSLAYILTVDILVLWRPASAQPGREKGWALRLGILLTMATGLLILASTSGLVLVLVGLLGVLAVVHMRIRVPDALSQSSGRSTAGVSEQWVVGESRPVSRRILHRTVARLLFKWPLNWLFLLPLMAFFGVMLGGYSPFSDEPGYMRFSNIVLTIYLLTTVAGYFTEKMHLLDHLPVDRRTMLAWLVVPAIAAMVLGYGGGQWLATRQAGTTEVFSFVNDDHGYGLKVPPRCFRLVKGAEAPFITAPWGESHRAQSVTAWKRLPWLFYKPYSTPDGASERFVAWQIGRAVQDVFGETLADEDIAGRYLATDGSGRPRVMDGGLSLVSDHPGWRETPGGPVFPALFGPIVVLYLLILALYFRLLRHHVSAKRQRFTFWGLMVVLLVLHVGGLILVEVSSDSWIIRGIVLGGIQRWDLTGAGAVPVAYSAFVLLTGLAWVLALSQFRQMEPPTS